MVITVHDLFFGFSLIAVAAIVICLFYFMIDTVQESIKCFTDVFPTINDNIFTTSSFFAARFFFLDQARLAVNLYFAPYSDLTVSN